MIENGARVETPKGLGTVKGSTGGYRGVYYTVELDNGGKDVFLDVDVKRV